MSILKIFLKNTALFKIKTGETYYKNGDTTDPSQQRCKISLTPVSEWEHILFLVRLWLQKVFRR